MEKIILNEKEYTKEEFEEKKKELEKEGIKLKEVAPGKFKTRLEE